MRPWQPDQHRNRPDGDVLDDAVAPWQVVQRRRRVSPEPAADAEPAPVAEPGPRLLILGEDRSLGRTLAEAGVRGGWHVTCFNAAGSAFAVAGARSMQGDRTSVDDVERLAKQGPWDWVVDSGVAEPLDTALAAVALRPAVSRYALVSGALVYRDWPHQPVDETSPRLSGTPASGCEDAVRDVYGGDALILRPGAVLDPYDPAGPLAALLSRAARGGRLPVAGDPDRPIQPVDARDLSDFALRLFDRGTHGAFNVGPPAGRTTYGDLITACAALTGAQPEWTGGAAPTDDLAGLMDTARAHAAGMVCRPIAETVGDTWKWLRIA